MTLSDTLRFSLSAVFSQKARTALTATGIAIGIMAVVLLTAIGEGIHRYVLAEFTQFGTNLIGISPGKTTTTGMSGAIVGNIRPLTLDDAEALRRVPHVLDVVSVTQGSAPVEFGQRRRHTVVYGATSAAPQVWQFGVSLGSFLPEDDPINARPYAVLGHKLYKELFGNKNPLGQRVRIGGHRYRVIGVMEAKGQLLGFDLDDAVYIPAARALEMFNRDSLMEIDVLYATGAEAEAVADAISDVLRARHNSEDFTIITQEQMLDTLSDILNILTLAVAAIGAISLLVGGIGILTIMTIAVNERTNEIGLLRAIGTTQTQVSLLFLGEAITLSTIGGLAGLILGAGVAEILHWSIPALPIQLSMQYIGLAVLIAVSIGLIAGVAPARHAARLDPIEALRAE